MNKKVAAALAEGDGVVLARAVPSLCSSLSRAHRSGELAHPLPGVFTAPEPGVATLCLAAVRKYSDAVICGAAALYLLGRSARPETIELACRGLRPLPLPYSLDNRRVAPEWVVQRGELRLEHPASAAVSPADRDRGSAIDDSLRLRLAPLTQMWQAFNAMPGRPGNVERFRVLRASRNEPWSPLERALHAVLNAAGLKGWRANYRVDVLTGTVYIDVAFPAACLAIEVDGYSWHSGPEVFESDRRKQNALVDADWRVLRLTWAMIHDEPDATVALIRRLLARRR